MYGRRAIRQGTRYGLLVALLVVAGLLPLASRPAAKSTYYRACHVSQAVTAPAPAPLQRPPRFEEGTVAFGVESFTSTWARAKGSLAGQDLDLYGARGQLGGYLVLSFQRWLSLGASFEVAIPGSELRVLPGPLGPPSGATGGGGLQVGFHFRLSRRVRLDWVSDLWLHRLRYRMRAQSAATVSDSYFSYEFCPPPDPSEAWLRDNTATLFLARSQLSLGVELGPVRLVAAVGLRSVPHHITGGEISWNGMMANPREVHTLYPYLWIGAAVPLGGGFSASAGLLQPLWADPMAYAPGLGVGLHFEAGTPLEGRR